MVAALLLSLLGSFSSYPYVAGSAAETPGARSAAIAKAGVAIADYADGVFYNPAGGAFASSVDASFELTPVRFSDDNMHIWHAAAQVPLRGRLTCGFFGAGYYGTIEGENFNFLSHDYLVGATASFLACRQVGIGLNLKYVEDYTEVAERRTTQSTEHSGYGFVGDAGLLAKHRVRFGELRAGLAVKDLGTPMYFADTSLSMGPTVRAGVAMLLAGGDAWPAPGTWYETRPWLAAWLAGRPRVILAYDVSLFPGRCPRHSIGFEVRPFPVLALRLGYYLVPDTNPSVPTGGMTWGFGFDFKFIRLDFANDDALYFFSQRRFRLSLALNLSEPLLSSGPLLH